jgi:uncharacterized membrane protein
VNTTADRLIENYLRELRRELSDLPRTSRQEVLDEIDEHIAAARAELDFENETAIRNVLERLGDPAAISDEARERFGLQRHPAGWREIAALVLLPIGGVILPLVGWFVGLILLWASDAWTTREKLLGTLVIPGGLLVPAWLWIVPTTSGGCAGEVDPKTERVIHETCTGGTSALAQAGWIALFAVLVIAPIAVAIWLARRMRRPAVSPA